MTCSIVDRQQPASVSTVAGRQVRIQKQRFVPGRVLIDPGYAFPGPGTEPVKHVDPQ